MPTCPICSLPLENVRHREGLFYRCARCDGRAAPIPHVRRIAGDRFAARLLRLLRLARAPGKLNCAFCAKPMVPVTAGEPAISAHGCLACNAVWLDGPTFETLAGGVVETTNSLASQATEIYAEIKLKELKDQQKAEEAEKRKRKKRIADL